jgi:sec-independent protein translocase protein TatA
MTAAGTGWGTTALSRRTGDGLTLAERLRSVSGGHRNEMPMVAVLESEWGIIIILVVVVLVFGSSQLPKLARSLGSAQSEFKKGLAEGKKSDGTDADAAAKGEAGPGDSAPKDSDKPSAAAG